MEDRPLTRYELVSRRALLKAAIAAGTAVAVPGLACGYDDVEIFAGAMAEPRATATPLADPIPAAAAPGSDAAGPIGSSPSVTKGDLVKEDLIDKDDLPASGEPAATATQLPIIPTATPSTEAASSRAAAAVLGEMVISFTYTQAAGGKNERPYVAVWLEDAAGDLAKTVAVFYQQQRRGERWLDHLHRWYERDEQFVASGGSTELATVSSATRSPGTYDLVWDGSIGGAAAPAGDYFVCIESAREDGPYSLIREAVLLRGTLPPTALPENGELSAASVRIDV